MYSLKVHSKKLEDIQLHASLLIQEFNIFFANYDTHLFSLISLKAFKRNRESHTYYFN